MDARPKWVGRGSRRAIIDGLGAARIKSGRGGNLAPPTSGPRRATIAFSAATLLTLCSAALLLLSTGACGKRPDVQSRVSELEKAFPQAAAPEPARGQEAVPNRAVAPDANTYVCLAISAVRSNDYAGGVLALQTVQRIPGVTPQQLMALERAKEAITANLVARAAAGDSRAKAELSAIEKTLSQ